jgi:cysteine-rich repeat protein
MHRPGNTLKFLWKTILVAAALAVALLVGARPALGGTITAQGAVTAITDRADLGPNAAEAHFDEGPISGTIPLDLYTPTGLTFHTGALTAVLAGVTTGGSASQGNYYDAPRFPAPIAGGGVNNPPAYCRYCGVATFSYPVTKVGLTASQNGTQYLTVWDVNGAMIGQVSWQPASDAAFVGLDTGGVEIGMVAYGNDDLWNGGTYGIGGSTIYSDTWVWGFCNLNGVLDPGEQCDDNNTTSGDGCSEFCIIETVSCGNSNVDPWEACDDGNNVDGDGCSANCMSDETCGNGYADTPIGEQCDDGNTTSGDGCSADCLSDETCGNGTTTTETVARPTACRTNHAETESTTPPPARSATTETPPAGTAARPTACRMNHAETASPTPPPANSAMTATTSVQTAARPIASRMKPAETASWTTCWARNATTETTSTATAASPTAPSPPAATAGWTRARPATTETTSTATAATPPAPPPRSAATG